MKQTRIHISEVKDKTASNLAGQFLDSDPYHQSILAGARAMVDAGYGQAKYLAQYASGNTCWQVDANTTKGVSYDGTPNWETSLEQGNILTAVALIIFGLAVITSAYLVLTLGVQGILQVVDALAGI